MLKIGDFSKICELPVKTLRYYDQQGLLPPARIDEHTGYRYYSEDQLLTVKRILSFKKEGFTLDQIKWFLNDISLHETITRLKAKQLDLHNVIEQAQKQFEEVDIRLNRLQNFKQAVGQSSISIRTIQQQLAATIRNHIPRSQLCLLLDDLLKYVRHHRGDAAANGPLTILWHGFGSNKHDPADIEVAIPLTEPIPSNDKVQMRCLPGMKAASLIHYCDPYADKCSAIDDLLTWISRRDGITVGSKSFRETYLTSDQEIYGRSRLSELLIPIIEAPCP